MSAWWVFGALGLHPSVPGPGVLTLGSPLFPRARIKLAHGTLDIRAPKAAAGRPYVVRAFHGKRRLRKSWIAWKQVSRGAKLTFELSGDPHQTWATGGGAAPPSYGGTAACGP